MQDSHKQLVDEDGEVDDANKLDPSLTRSKLQVQSQWLLSVILTVVLYKKQSIK